MGGWGRDFLVREGLSFWDWDMDFEMVLTARSHHGDYA